MGTTPRSFAANVSRGRRRIFVEAACASEFSRFDFLQCENVFGSGARLTAEGWVVVSPSHSLEAIYILKRNDGDWYASNSLAFLLASSKADIQFKYSSLAAFMWVVEGIDHSPQHIRVSNGVLSILHHHNVSLGVELTVR